MPYEKILELVEARKLDITTVSLAQVTGDFLLYLSEHKAEFDHQEVAAFLVVASRLLLIKSKVLLPGVKLEEAEEEEILELETRLNFYKQLKPSFKLFEGLWGGGERLFFREFLAHKPKVFLGAENLKVENLLLAIQNLVDNLSILEVKREEAVMKVISLEEKINHLVDRLKLSPRIHFHELTTGQNRAEIVAAFLAVLHLYRERKISFEQEELFAEILISKLEQ